MRDGQALHAIDQPEKLQILNHRQIPGQRRIDGGKIGTRQSLRAFRGDIQSVYRNGSRRGLEHAQNHIDGGGLPGAVRAQQPYDLVTIHVERNAIDGQDIAVVFSQFTHRQYGGSHTSV